MTYTQTLRPFSWIRFGILLQIKAPLIGSWHQIPTIFNSLGLVNYKLSDPLPKIHSDIFKPANFILTELLVWKLNHVRHVNYSQKIKSFILPLNNKSFVAYLGFVNINKYLRILWFNSYQQSQNFWLVARHVSKAPKFMLK